MFSFLTMFALITDSSVPGAGLMMTSVAVSRAGMPTMMLPSFRV